MVLFIGWMEFTNLKDKKDDDDLFNKRKKRREKQVILLTKQIDIGNGNEPLEG